MNANTQVILKCHVCGADYKQQQCRANTSKYCSRKCFAQRGSTVPIKTCEGCGTEFKTFDRRQKYCCKACSTKYMRGPKAAQWKGGATLKNERARMSRQLVVWRLAVYRRDGFKCTKCGAGRNLNAHHVKSFSEFPELRTNVDNGITVCEKCHGEIHGKDFSNRRKKTCGTCGKKTKGRGKLCSSCAIKNWHAKRSNLQPSSSPE